MTQMYLPFQHNRLETPHLNPLLISHIHITHDHKTTETRQNKLRNGLRNSKTSHLRFLAFLVPLEILRAHVGQTH